MSYGIGQASLPTWQAALAHGTAQGFISVAQGGKFGHGFASAFVSKLANVNDMIGVDPADKFARVLTAAVIGGTTSAITDGKFVNGAVTAAYVQLVNKESKIEENQKLAEYIFTRIRQLDMKYRSDRAILAGFSVVLGEKKSLEAALSIVNHTDSAKEMRLHLRNVTVKQVLPRHIENVSNFIESFYLDTKTGVFGVGLVLGSANKIGGVLYNGVNDTSTVFGASALKRMAKTNNVGLAIERAAIDWYANRE